MKWDQVTKHLRSEFRGSGFSVRPPTIAEEDFPTGICLVPHSIESEKPKRSGEPHTPDNARGKGKCGVVYYFGVYHSGDFAGEIGYSDFGTWFSRDTRDTSRFPAKMALTVASHAPKFNRKTEPERR